MATKYFFTLLLVIKFSYLFQLPQSLLLHAHPISSQSHSLIFPRTPNHDQHNPRPHLRDSLPDPLSRLISYFCIICHQSVTDPATSLPMRPSPLKKISPLPQPPQHPQPFQWTEQVSFQSSHPRQGTIAFDLAPPFSQPFQNHHIAYIPIPLLTTPNATPNPKGHSPPPRSEFSKVP